MNKSQKIIVDWLTPRIGITNAENGILASESSRYVVVNVAGEVSNEKADIQMALLPYACEKPKLDFLANWLNHWIHTEGGQVILHCQLGEDRSPLVVAWYFHIHRGMSLDQAYEKIKKVRPQVNDRRTWVVNIVSVEL